MRLLLFLAIFLLAIKGKTQDENQFNESDRLYGLAQFWKGVDMNFAFFEQVPELNWDSLFNSYIPKVKAAKNDFEYARLLQEMCHQLNDGHTRVFIPWRVRKHRGFPPLYTEKIEGKVFITFVLNEKVTAQGLKPGMEILAIDGVEVHEYANTKIKPYCFASTIQDMDVKVYEENLLEGWKTEPVSLKLKDQEGNTSIVAVRRDLKIEEPKIEGLSFKKLSNNIGHLKLTRFWGDDFKPTFDSIYPMLKNTSALIIDIRDNDGGQSDNAEYILQHLSNKPFYTSNWSTPVYNAAFASWGMKQEFYQEKGELRKPIDKKMPYNKPVIVLIGSKTYSAAEDFCSYYQQAKIGPMMGTPTAGSTGNPIGVNLVKDLWAQVCTKKDVFYDGTEFVGYGVKPDIIVEQSTTDFWQGKDTVLKEAIHYLEKQLK